jgi:hypothetical protein
MKKKAGYLVSILLCILIIFTGNMSWCQAAGSEITYCGDAAFIKKTKETLISKDSSTQTSGKTYYVSNKGKNKWKGTKKRPFRTFKYALSKLKKGDTLYIRGGVYKEQLKIPKSLKGNASNYITISGMPGEKVIIDGRKKKGPTLVDINGAAYIKICGLELRNAIGQNACGILVNAKSHHLIISNNKIHDIIVNEPEKRDQCANGILLYGDSPKHSIHNVLIYNNKLYDCQTGWSECISVTANVKNINIISNTITKTGNIGIDLSGNYGYCKRASVDFPRNCLVYDNKVSKCVSKNATSYGIYVDGGQKITITGNTVQKCSGGIEIGAEKKASKKAYCTSDIVVKNNLIKNNIKNAVTIGGYRKNLGWVKNVHIENNKCINNGKKNAILTLAKCKNITIKDNLFYNKSGKAAVVYSEFSSKYTKNIKFLNNTYYNGRTKNKTTFVYLGKTYTSFKKWTNKIGSNAGNYKK